jgi:hypothetical protein
MKSVLELIDKRIRTAELKKRNCIERINVAYWDGVSIELQELKKEILNEAVVCGSERNQTMCNRANVSLESNKNVAQYCFTCKKEFDFLGKEISS